MLFAGSKPEVQSILGLQEQNKICLQSNPPQCFDIGDPFQQAETGGIKNKVFDKSTIRQGGFTKPSELDLMDIREILRRNEEKFKAEVPETWNEGTGIEKGGYENAPQWLRDQIWKQDLRKRQELGLEPVAS
tara:strand:- start:52 stop:447 length:396 start_codon:yes stop_codon:yes gene_type:complete